MGEDFEAQDFFQSLWWNLFNYTCILFLWHKLFDSTFWNIIYSVILLLLDLYTFLLLLFSPLGLFDCFQAQKKILMFRKFPSTKFLTMSYALTTYSNSNRRMCLICDHTPFGSPGVSGAGKTTLSRFVACINGLSVFQIKRKYCFCNVHNIILD